jgi:hypothetical protein
MISASIIFSRYRNRMDDTMLSFQKKISLLSVTRPMEFVRLHDHSLSMRR